MSIVLLHRSARRPGPEMPEGELELQEPPVLPEPQSGMSGVISYAPMALSSLAMVMLFIRPGDGGGPLNYIAIGLMAASAVGMLVTQLVRGAGDRKRQVRGERRDYLRYLSQIRRQVRKMIARQQGAQAWRHPDPSALWSLVGTSRMWERRPAHEDFGDVRIAVGDQQLAVQMGSLSTKPVADLEPLCAHALRRFIRAYSAVAEQPVAVYLRAFSRVLVQGDHAVILAWARSVVAQLAVFHAPEELRIVVVCGPERRGRWEWVKWLPHALHPTDADGAGSVRLTVDTMAELEPLLGEEFGGRAPFEVGAQPNRDEPYTVIVVDGAQPPANGRLAGAGYRNCTVLDVDRSFEWKADRHVLRLRIGPDGLEMLSVDANDKETSTHLGRPDSLGPAATTTLARLMAPYRIGDSPEATEPLAADVELTTMLGIQDLNHHDVQHLWQQRTPGDRLRVPFGVAADGSPIELDFKESAQGGMGPHGMLIGATGSGKSELLRTLVLALALNHSSETLNFVLVDFKGGATFLGLDQLPHTSAVITNLADEAALVDRMRDALHGELVRRQELLRKAGNFSSALEYETARAGGARLDPLPTLLVVVDEFSELLAAHRDFMDLFIMIGRLGRSLGVHLLLASQRLDEGRMHQLESHLSYRIGLRTFSAMESRGVLGVPDAYQLPSEPGNGFLRHDTANLTRFKAAYVSGGYRHARRAVPQAVVAGQVVPYATAYVAARSAPEPVAEEETPAEETRTLLQVALDRLRGAGPAAHQVWLAPLNESPTLDRLLPPIVADPERGLTTAATGRRRPLAVPVGIIDRPFNQVRDLLVADLSGSGGHVGIAGGPQSGKSTLVRTLIAGLALTSTPREVQFYCLDFGGGSLSGLADLPHVGSVTGRLDLERVGRTIAEINTLIAQRERRFAELGIDSMTEFRRRQAAGETVDCYGDVFLVVDGWGTVRQDLNDLVPALTLIATRGLNYGVHIVVTSNRWAEIPAGLRDQLGTRLELKLGDAIDSVINMRTAANVPKAPGRGLTDEQLHFLTALPRIDGVASGGDLGDGVATLVQAVAEHWHGPGAPAVRTLPLVLDAASLPEPEGTLRVALGLEEQELAPLWHDFAETPHLLVVGDAETGKTNLLKLVTAAVSRRYTPAEAKVLLVDYRRELFDAVPEGHRLGYAVSLDLVRQVVDGVARAMRTRLPAADITPARMRKRDWWSGPELFIVIDDYDLVVGSQGNNPFGPLLDFLAQGAELGVHLVVARSANGIGRGVGDPLLRTMLDANTPVVLLSCPPSEGYAFGDVKPRQLPAGRALHITRRRSVQVQTGFVGPRRQPAGHGGPVSPQARRATTHAGREGVVV